MPTLQKTGNFSATELADLAGEATLIHQYFELFNAGRFQQVSQLFAEDGALYPPFEPPVSGPDAIKAYLCKEADGMVAEPLSFEVKSRDGDCLKVAVLGKVTALVFHVKVAWEFDIASSQETQEICAVRVNLLASLGELLNLRSA